jgi:ubiquinone/menaquinone biosynthesis C-methylase UbiE
MIEKKFDPAKLQRLNNPERLKLIPPDFIWAKLGLKDPKVLVDVGAGTGFFAVSFLQYMNQGKIFACDISEMMLSWMKDNICLKYPGIEVIKMQESVLPLKNEVADLVYMINLHHELDEPDVLFGECFRVLKKGGKIFIADWKKEDMDEGPPLGIRILPETVGQQLLGAKFQDIKIDVKMPKHFLVLGKKRV